MHAQKAADRSAAFVYLHLFRYERVTLYTPQAVNSTVTVIVWVPRMTTAVILPASKRGASVQLAL